MTPNFAVVRVETPGWRGFPVLLPLFLLWIPVVLLSPLIFLVVVGVCLAFRVDPWRAISVVWSIVCSLPGTHVRVCADGKRIVVRVL
jgi:hypothetical protein